MSMKTSRWHSTVVALGIGAALVASACGTTIETADEPAVEVTTYNEGDHEETAPADGVDNPADIGTPEPVDDDPAAPADGAETPADDGTLGVSIDCPDSFVLNEKLVCEIVSTGAVSGEWRLPGFLDGPLSLDTVPGSNGIFVEPTDASYVGAWFTLTATVYSADGEAATDSLRFTVESSVEAASLIDELNAITSADPVNFASGSAEVQAGDRPTLDQVAQLLASRPGTRIEIGGHTDDVGSDEANQALSLARADSVVAYLVGQGVDAGRLDAAGYGRTQPVAPNTTDEGRAANRRIEFREIGDGPFISVDCPTEFVIGIETLCDIVTANAVEGSWRIDGFTNGDVVLQTVPGTNEIFVSPSNPDFAGSTFIVEVEATDASGRLARAEHRFTLVLE